MERTNLLAMITVHAHPKQDGQERCRILRLNDGLHGSMSGRTAVGSLVLHLAIVICHDLGLPILGAHDGSLLAYTNSSISSMDRRPTDTFWHMVGHDLDSPAQNSNASSLIYTDSSFALVY